MFKDIIPTDYMWFCHLYQYNRHMSDATSRETLTSATVHYTGRGGQERRLVIRLDHQHGVPRFEQLRAQLSVMVAVGRLESGARLPTVRQLATQIGLAPGTVARTYRELERDGVVVTRGRAGTFVADEPPHSEPLRERRERLQAAAERYVFDVRQLGIATDDIVQAVVTALADVDETRG